MKYISKLIVITIIELVSSSLIENQRNKFVPKFHRNVSSTFSKNSPTFRIIGGEVAPAGRFPYQVAIQNDFGIFCGGVLLSDTFVLTVAHCIDGIFYLIAIMGVHNIRDRNEDWIEMVIHRDSCQIHPEWDPDTRANDIALIEFPEPIILSEIVNVVALPSWSDQSIEYDNEFLTITGWGYDSNDAEGLTPLLHFSQLKILPMQVCRHFFPDLMHDTNVCTDTGLGRGICHGDSGAPIVYVKQDGNPIVVGLGSLISSLGCASGWPDLFTRVDPYLDWIESITKIKIKQN